MGIQRKGTVRQGSPIASKSNALGVATSGKLRSDTAADAKTAKLIGTAPRAKSQNKQENGKFSSTSGSGGTGSTTGSMQLGGVSLNIDLEPLMSGMNYGTDDIHLYEVYRDMYFFDPIAGGIVDLQSTLPFSSYTFGGAKDSVLEPFYEVNQGLKLESMLSLMSIDRQVTGTHISSIIFNREKKQFLDLMTHRMDNIEATPIPFLSHDPILELTVPEELKRALAHASPRIQKLKEMLGPDLVAKFEGDKVELDATGTIYCPRKCFTYGEGVSYYRRILPIWLIEKNLYRGTLIESGRRQRGILHAQMGDGGEWEPSIDEMEYITDLLLSADADPIGSVIATRLGVNINEFRCFAGTGTLVHTENGLMEMSSLVDHNPEELEPDTAFKINIEIKSLDGIFKTAKYLHYRGFGDVFKTTTESGTQFRTTVDHKFLTVDFNAGVTVAPICDIHKDRGYLLLENNGLTYDRVLPLNLTRSTQDRSDNRLIMPKHMTPELAYLLGIIVSEGYVSKNGVEINNTDTELLDKVVHCVYVVFGKHIMYEKSRNSGAAVIKGKNYQCKDVHRLYINGRVIVGWLQQLGVVIGSNVVTDASPCYAYEVPWSILQADMESRSAFIAAYLDGDGSVVDKSNSSNSTVECKIFSQSQKLLQQLKVLLSDMGFKSRIEHCLKTEKSRLYVATSEAHALYNLVSPYMACSRKTKFASCSNTRQHKYGIPADVWLPCLLSRKVGSSHKGVCFTNEEGQEVVLAGFGTLFRHLTNSNSVLNYNVYADGGYEDHLKMIKAVSPTLYNNLVYLLEARYTFEKTSTFVADGSDHLYDISMSRAKGTLPSFLVNGCLVRNSGGDFWKVSDFWDQAGAMKMKALGVSDAFLSGDATFANGDTGLSVFMESLRSFRDQITRNVFYEKIFPLVSIMNGLTVNRNGKVVVSNMIKGDYNEIMGRMRDGSRLFIPQVHWSKQLHPDSNQAAMDSLRAMQELGIPVGLRAIAAAGGFNLEQLLTDVDENIAYERKVMEYKKRINSLRKRYGLAEGEDQQQSMSSVSSNSSILTGSLPRSAVLGGAPRPRFADRNWDSEIVGRTVTGKKKAIYNQKQANEKANVTIAKAMRELVNGRNTPLTEDTVTPFLPRGAQTSW